MPLTVIVQAVLLFHGGREGWGNRFVQKTPVPPKRWQAITRVMTRAARLLYAPFVVFTFPLILPVGNELVVACPPCTFAEFYASTTIPDNDPQGLAPSCVAFYHCVLAQSRPYLHEEQPASSVVCIPFRTTTILQFRTPLAPCRPP